MTEHWVDHGPLDPLDPIIGVEVPMNVTVSMDSRYSVAWVKAIKISAPVLLRLIGQDRTERLAYWGALRLTRIRFDNERWHFLRPEEAA